MSSKRGAEPTIRKLTALSVAQSETDFLAQPPSLLPPAGESAGPFGRPARGEGQQGRFPRGFHGFVEGGSCSMAARMASYQYVLVPEPSLRFFSSSALISFARRHLHRRSCSAHSPVAALGVAVSPWSCSTSPRGITECSSHPRLARGQLERGRRRLAALRFQLRRESLSLPPQYLD